MNECEPKVDVLEEKRDGKFTRDFLTIINHQPKHHEM